jgi:hypothetical protein
VALFQAGAIQREDPLSQPLPALLEAGWLLIALLIPLAVDLWCEVTAQPLVRPATAFVPAQTQAALPSAERSLGWLLLSYRLPQKGILHDPA